MTQAVNGMTPLIQVCDMHEARQTWPHEPDGCRLCFQARV